MQEWNIMQIFQLVQFIAITFSTIQEDGIEFESNLAASVIFRHECITHNGFRFTPKTEVCFTHQPLPLQSKMEFHPPAPPPPPPPQTDKLDTTFSPIQRFCITGFFFFWRETTQKRNTVNEELLERTHFLFLLQNIDYFNGLCSCFSLLFRQYLFVSFISNSEMYLCLRRQPSRHGCPECRHRQRRFLQIISTKGQALGWPVLLMYWPQQHVSILFWRPTLCSLIK